MNPDMVFQEKLNPLDGFSIYILSKRPQKLIYISFIIDFKALYYIYIKEENKKLILVD
jgi:hypothetical protein